jgi:hypothetical protein
LKIVGFSNVNQNEDYKILSIWDFNYNFIKIKIKSAITMQLHDNFIADELMVL